MFQSCDGIPADGWPGGAGTADGWPGGAGTAAAADGVATGAPETGTPETGTPETGAISHGIVAAPLARAELDALARRILLASPQSRVEVAVLLLLARLLVVGPPPQAGTDPGGHVQAGGDPVPRADDWAERHALAVTLEAMPAGPDLSALLAGLEVADVDDAALVEMIAGWQRVISWAAAAQANAVNELHRRRDSQGRSAYVGDEVAARLGTSRRAGESQVSFALGLQRLPEISDALTAGTIDIRKASMFLDELCLLEPGLAHRIAAAVLPGAQWQTIPRLRAKIRRLELAVDPGAAEQRHVKARADRKVVLEPDRDAMAWLTAYLPADEAVAVYTALTAVADAAAPDDARTADQRRADALVDLATRCLEAGSAPDGTPLPKRQRRRPHLDVTASAETLLGLAEEPGELAGYGPVPASLVRKIAAGATWRPVLIDAGTGERIAQGRRYRPSTEMAEYVIARDRTCSFPGCRTLAERCDIDHIEAFDPSRPASEQTVPPNLQALCRHHHLAKTHGGWRMRRDVSGTTTAIAPTGHRYLREPPTEPPTRLQGNPPQASRPQESRPPPDPPPF